MTKQEAVEQLTQLKGYCVLMTKNSDSPFNADVEAINFAIKAIETYRDCGTCKHNVKIGNMRGCNADGCEYEQRGEEDE